MMFAAKKIETAANTEYVESTIFGLKTDQELDYKQTFLLDWTLYNEKTTDEVKDKISL